MKKLKRLAVVFMAVAMTVTQSNIMTLAADTNISFRSVSDNAIDSEQENLEIIEEEDTAVYDAGDNEGDENSDNQVTETEDITIDEEHFTDENFRKYVANNFDVNEDNALSDSEIEKAKEFVYKSESTKSFKGIEYLTALEKIELTGCYECKELDLSGFKSLKKVDIYDCSFEKIIVSNNEALTDISIDKVGKNIVLDVFSNSKMRKLPIKETEFKTVNISDNGALYTITFDKCKISKTSITDNSLLESVYFSNCNLSSNFISGLGKKTKLIVKYCNAAELDFSDVPEIEELRLYDNDNLMRVDISKCSYIDIIQIYDNPYLNTIKLPEKLSTWFLSILDNGRIDEFDIGVFKDCETIVLGNITLNNADFSDFEYLAELEINSCNLKKIRFDKNDKLNVLDVSYNLIEELDLSDCYNLYELICANNNLTKLDVTNNIKLQILKCSNNKLTELDLSNNIYLDELDIRLNNISEIDISKTDLYVNKYSDLGIQKNYKNMIIKLLDKQLDESVKEELEESNNITFSFIEDNICFAIDESNFPDEAFRNLLLAEFDKDGDGKLSEYELRHARQLSLGNNIKTFKGLDLLKYLISLYIVNETDEIDLSSNTYLERLFIKDGKFEQIDLSNNQMLAYLYIINNENLKSIDLTNNRFVQLVINNTGLETITFSREADYISELNLKNNELESLDISNFKAIGAFDCTDNRLSEISLFNFGDYKRSEYSSLNVGSQKDDMVINAYVSGTFYENNKDEEWFKRQQDNNVNFIAHEHEADGNNWYYDGDTHYQKCKGCDVKLNVSKHEATVSENAVALPKCNERFVKDYYVCKCGLFENSECTKKIDDFAAWSKDEKNLLPAGPHSWNQGVITKNATYFEKGVKVYTCSVCKETKTEDIEKLDYIEVPAKGKYDVKQAVNYLMTVSGNSTNGYTYTKFKYTVSDKKVASVSSKGILKAKKDGKIKVTVFGRNASKKYDELGSFDILVKTPNITKKVTVTSLNEAIDLNKLVDNIPAGYAVSFDISKSSAKKAELDKATNMIKPVKKGTITVKCIIGEGKYALKKSIKIVVKPAK